MTHYQSPSRLVHVVTDELCLPVRRQSSEAQCRQNAGARGFKCGSKKVYGLQNADSSAQNVSLCEAFARISEQILELFSEVLVTLTFDL